MNEIEEKIATIKSILGFLSSLTLYDEGRLLGLKPSMESEMLKTCIKCYRQDKIAETLKHDSSYFDKNFFYDTCDLCGSGNGNWPCVILFRPVKISSHRYLIGDYKP
jgi:hypothetical protein